MKSLTNPAVANKRLPIGGHPYSSQLSVNGFRTVPELKSRTPAIDSDEVVTPIRFSGLQGPDGWNDKLGMELTAPEKTFADTGKKLLELEEKFAKA